MLPYANEHTSYDQVLAGSLINIHAALHSLHLGEANQSLLEMKLRWCLQVGLIV